MPLPPDPPPTWPPRRIVRFELAPKTLFAVVLICAAAWTLTQLATVLLVLIGALMIEAR